MKSPNFKMVSMHKNNQSTNFIPLKPMAKNNIKLSLMKKLSSDSNFFLSSLKFYHLKNKQKYMKFQ